MALSDRQYYTLRRLHSLSGVVPVGIFLLNHFLTNSFAVAGEKSFNDKVDFLRSLPYLYLIEIFGIFLPIAFHGIVGLWIFKEAKFNNRNLGYRNNVLFTIQRVTGVLLLFFIGYHLLTTRFSYLIGIDNANLYQLMYDKLQSPIVLAVYLVGIVAASYHLGNGLFGFTIHWGLVTSRKAQKRMATAGLAIGLVLSVVGINALMGFQPLEGKLQPVQYFQHDKGEHAEGAHEGDKAAGEQGEQGEQAEASEASGQAALMVGGEE